MQNECCSKLIFVLVYLHTERFSCHLYTGILGITGSCHYCSDASTVCMCLNASSPQKWICFCFYLCFLCNIRLTTMSRKSGRTCAVFSCSKSSENFNYKNKLDAKYSSPYFTALTLCEWPALGTLWSSLTKQSMKYSWIPTNKYMKYFLLPVCND